MAMETPPAMMTVMILMPMFRCYKVAVVQWEPAVWTSSMEYDVGDDVYTIDPTGVVSQSIMSIVI